MQKKLRDFISQYNKRFNATILLTSHYIEDVKQLAQRVIVIDHGAIVFDGKLSELVKRYARYKLISFSLDTEIAREKFNGLGDIQLYDLPRIVIKTKRDNSNAVAAKLLESFPISDITIEEPTTEDIIRDLFSTIQK
jgi:ABC-2 type transport system ATP-binding protein